MGDAFDIDPLDGSDLVRTARSFERTVRDRRAVSPSEIPSPLHSPTSPLLSGSLRRAVTDIGVSHQRGSAASLDSRALSRTIKSRLSAGGDVASGRYSCVRGADEPHPSSIIRPRILSPCDRSDWLEPTTTSTRSRLIASSRLTICRCLQGLPESPSKTCPRRTEWSSQRRPCAT